MMSVKEKVSEKTKRNKLLIYAAAGIVLAASLLLFAPAAGVFRTIPFIAVGGAAVYVSGISVKYAGFFTALLTVCVYRFSARTYLETAVFTAASLALFLLGAFVARLFCLSKKTQNNTVRKKAVVLAVCSIVAVFVISALCCGNVVSFLKHDSDNTEYIETNYPDSVKKIYTMYDFTNMEYRTYVVYENDGYLFGDKFEYYITDTHDSVKEYVVEEMLDEVEYELSKIVADSKAGFFVVDSKLMMNSKDADINQGINQHKSSIAYVLCYEGLMMDHEKERFELLCRDALYKIAENGFAYESIVFCAGNGKDVLFSAKAENNDMVTEGKVFNDDDIKDYDVTKEDVLGYWQNN